MVAIDTGVDGYKNAKLLLEKGVEIVCGGFPCQDISTAGKGAGLAGERSGLWREMLRTIRLVRPRYAIVENVAALLGRGMGTVLGDMAEIGYDAEWGCISAADVGAPHLRRRIWIIGTDAHQKQLNSLEEIKRCGEQTSNPERIHPWLVGEEGEDIQHPNSKRWKECNPPTIPTRERLADWRHVKGRQIWPSQPPVCGVVNGIS